MIFHFNNHDEPIEVQQLDAIHNALRPSDSGQGDTECEVFPLRDIPVGMEDAPIMMVSTPAAIPFVPVLCMATVCLRCDEAEGGEAEQ